MLRELLEGGSWKARWQWERIVGGGSTLGGSAGKGVVAGTKCRGWEYIGAMEMLGELLEGGAGNGGGSRRYSRDWQ